MILSDQEMERLAKAYLGKAKEFRARVSFTDYLESQPYACEVDEAGRELPRMRLERVSTIQLIGVSVPAFRQYARDELAQAVVTARAFVLREAEVA